MARQTFLRANQILRLGTRAPEVSRLQRFLNAYPPTKLPPLKIDGIFGEGTRARVVEFQNTMGLVPDGVVGPATAGALALTLPEMEELVRTVRGLLATNGADQRGLMAFDRSAQRLIDETIPVTGGAAIAVPVVIFALIVFYMGMMALMQTPRARQAQQEFIRHCQQQIDELRQALDLPTPMQTLERAIESIRITVRKFIETLQRERLKCDMSPEKLMKCSKQSMAVAIATQSLMHKLEQLTFVGSRGFKLDDLVAGILASCGALVVAYAELGGCLGCEFIQFL